MQAPKFMHVYHIVLKFSFVVRQLSSMTLCLLCCLPVTDPTKHSKRRQGIENSDRDDKGVENTTRDFNCTTQ